MQQNSKLRINLDRDSYDILIEHGLLEHLGALISEKFGKPRTFIVTDKNISEHWLEQTLDSFSSKGIFPKVLEVPEGESTKSFDNLEKIIDQLLEAEKKGTPIFKIKEENFCSFIWPNVHIVNGNVKNTFWFIFFNDKLVLPFNLFFSFFVKFFK